MSDLAPTSLAADSDSSETASDSPVAVLKRPARPTISADSLMHGEPSTASRRGTPLLAVNLALTIFVSAFLLFQVQPLISKYILPWFGGSPAVWTTCMLFFQVTLFAGYAYAHLLTRLAPRWQAIVHGSLLVAAVVVMFPTIAPGVHWKPIDSANPTGRIVLLLAATVGLPYFVLSTTGPLVQAWFARIWPDRSPYRLYSLSNVGSLAALVTYPFLFEPAFASDTQAALWSVTFGLFVVLCGVAAAWVFKLPVAVKEAVAHEQAATSGARVSVIRRVLWVSLPGCASLMLLATTNYVCQDVAVIPFLWVVPLALYLLTFIICFDHSRWYRPVPMAIAATVLLILSAGAADDLADLLNVRIGFILELCLYFGTMFAACMVCHGELVRLRPQASRLTEYYMLISAGGALGGIFVSLIAPHIFRTHLEWTLALAASLTVSLAVWLSRMGWASGALGKARWVGGFASVGLAIPTVLGGAHWLVEGAQRSSDAIYRGRNFYGTVAVLETDHDNPELHHRTFVSGSTRHGKQYCAPEKRHIPISYYAEHTGVAKALKFFQDRPDTRVGIVGMGVGVVAAYARPGQYYRFYEINEQVVDIANEHFTCLKDCQAKYDIVVADARLALERELAARQPQRFDVLVLDAFTSDAPPVHLLTAEAFELYLEHLKPDGVIVVNITNRYIDLAPVINAVAKQYDLGVTRVMTPYEEKKLLYRTDFMIVTRNQDFLAATPPVLMPEYLQPDYEVPLWTDKYSNLFGILKR